MRPRQFEAAAAVLLYAVAGSACLGPRADPSRFYVLEPMTASGAAASGDAFSVGVGPVAFPRYLDRPQMATRVSPTELEFSETHRWAQALRASFPATVAENLSTILGWEHVLAYPWYESEAPTYAVAIDVLRFERDASGAALLRCRWRVLDTRDGSSLHDGQSDYSEPVSGVDVASSVAALSRAIERLSRDVAEVIRRSTTR